MEISREPHVYRTVLEAFRKFEKHIEYLRNTIFKWNNIPGFIDTPNRTALSSKAGDCESSCEPWYYLISIRANNFVKF